MSRPQFFIIVSAMIFLLERVLPTLVSWPIFIFPVFAILFLLTSKNDVNEFVYVVIAAFIFDPFSGYSFGTVTVVTFVIIAAIFWFKASFNVNAQSFLSLAAYTLIFVFLYFALLSIKSDPKLIITQAHVIVIETLVLFTIFILWTNIFPVRAKN